MAAAIKSVKAYVNNEVAFIAWTVEAMIPGCLGFEVTRIYQKDDSERVLASWVPFRGQGNKEWDAQTTSVWPIQKLCWRDLTLRRKRDSNDVRIAETVRYRVRPVGRLVAGLDPVPVDPKAKPYQGAPLALGYLAKGTLSNWVTPTASFGKNGEISVAFTNGILSAQWLRKAIEGSGATLTADVLRARMNDTKDKTRRYLAGDVLQLLKTSLGTKGTLAALYELGDPELVEAIKSNAKNLDIILSNSSKPKDGTDWDHGNAKARTLLRAANVRLTDRMFNNNHIGHNKFTVNPAKGIVVTGSTNWTATGVCGQSNNVIAIQEPTVAAAYTNYWKGLETDTKDFVTPSPLSAGTSNKQGPALRLANGSSAACDSTLSDGTRIRAWFSPNTKRTTKGTDLPPDLADIYTRIRKAQHAILFAVFMPSRSGKTSIIEEAISLGLKDPSVLVYGAISDPTAMPNYVAPSKDDEEDEDHDGPRPPLPAVYDHENVHVIRAAALTKADLVGEFESELLKVGNAIIHDKIIVIDPLSKNCTVVVGSHNLGYKASYENDENLLVIENNRELAQAYAVHIIDVYDHYRFRAAQQEARRQGKEAWDGVLETDDLWLKRYLKNTPNTMGSTASLVGYFGK